MRRNTVLVLLALICVGLLTGCPPLRRAPKLFVSTTILRFQEGELEKTFTVYNSGSFFTVLTFDVAVDKAFVTVDPDSGRSTGSRDKKTITVTLDRAEAAAEKAAFDAATITVTSNGGTKKITVSVEPDFFTEEYSATNEFDLHGSTTTFVPDGTDDYEATGANATAFPVDPTGGTVIDFEAGDPAEVALAGGSVVVYGESYDTMYVSSDGYVAFGEAGANTGALDLDGHFAVPAVSGLRADLDSVAGTVSVRETAAGVAVSYEDVEVSAVADEMYDFQIQMLFDGTIRLTYLDGGTPDAIVGLSAGGGVPEGYVPSDISAYNTEAAKAEL